MNGPYIYFGKYGVQADFYFVYEDPNDPSRAVQPPLGFVAGDHKISKDGGALANTSNSPSSVGGGLFYFTLTATEMEAEVINVVSIDQSGTNAWSDLHIVIYTKLSLGQLDVDISNFAGDAHAVALTGVGTGYGLFAKGSSGIRGEAQGTSGHGIVGVGVGPGQGLQGVKGATGRVCNFWDTQEGAEPSGAPADDATFGEIQQYLKRRHTNKVTQDSGDQVWYKDDSLTVLTQRSVSDDLTTQVQNKLA